MRSGTATRDGTVMIRTAVSIHARYNEGECTLTITTWALSDKTRLAIKERGPYESAVHGMGHKRVRVLDLPFGVS